MDDFTDEETYPFEPEKYHPIPAKAIILLVKKGRINLPITPDQEQALELLRYVWSEKVFLRFQLAELEKKERLLLAEYPRYGKLDRYLLSLFLDTEKKYSIKEAKAMVLQYFKIEVSDEQVKKIRTAAYNYKKPQAEKAKEKLQNKLSKQTKVSKNTQYNI
jgi:hypothetical protein